MKLSPLVFFRKNTSPNKTFTNQKNFTKQKNITNQKKLSPNPLYPISSESKTKTTRFPTFHHHLPLLQPSLRLWCSYQGKDVDYRRPRSKAMEKTQGRAAEGLWLTAQLLVFFVFGWKKKKISKNLGKDVDIYLDGKINLLKKKRRNVEVVGLFLWVNFGRVFSP